MFIFQATKDTDWLGLAGAGTLHFPPPADAKPPPSRHGEHSLPELWASLEMGSRAGMLPLLGQAVQTWSTRAPVCLSDSLPSSDENTTAAFWFCRDPAVQEKERLP